MPVDWKSAETTRHLLVAFMAANDKPDLKLIAQLLSLSRGEEVTYGALNFSIRSIRNEAIELRERFQNGGIATDTADKSKETAKGKKEGVLSGRVEKSAGKAKKGMARKAQKSDRAMDEGEDSGVGGGEDGEVVAKLEPVDD